MVSILAAAAFTACTKDSTGQETAFMAEGLVPDIDFLGQLQG